jgi:hypothetical protein
LVSSVVAALLTLPATSSAQISPRPGGAVLSGRVVDAQGQPINGADVTLLDRRVVTDGQGAFRLRDIPAGTHTLAVRHLGHSPLARQIEFAPDDSLVERLVLARVAALDSVTVTGHRSGVAEFEERRASGGGGHFVTREQIDKYPTKRMADVLRPLPGLRVSAGRGGRGDLYAINSRGTITILGPPTCYVHVYVDGAPMYTGGMQQPYNLNSLSASDIEGIEYYQGGSAIPPKYNRSAACGVLVIWTRRQ